MATKPELGKSNHLLEHIQTEQKRSWTDGRTELETHVLPLGMIEDDRNCASALGLEDVPDRFCQSQRSPGGYKYIQFGDWEWLGAISICAQKITRQKRTCHTSLPRTHAVIAATSKVAFKRNPGDNSQGSRTDIPI